MRKTVAPMVLAFLLLTASVTPLIPIEQAYSLLPEKETFAILVQKDSFIKQGSQAHNEGLNVVLNVISSDKHRPVIAFDTAAIGSAVDGRPLQSAILRLYVTDNGNNWGYSGNTIGAHRLLSEWHEGDGWNLGNNIAGAGSGVTWACAIDSDISNNQNDCATQWDGGSFQSPVTSNVLITNNFVNQWVEFDVTSDVQAFLDETATNYGWLIKKTTESQNGALQFASKEAAANKPELSVTVIRPEAVLANEYLSLVDGLDNVGRNLNQTEITQTLVDDIDSDLERIKEIVIELQNLGFDGEVSADRVGGQMVGTVKFHDSGTNELLFETQIADGTLGVFAAIGLGAQFAEEGLVLPLERLSQLLRVSFGIAQAISSFEDDEIARDFVLASIAPFHPSTGQTVNFVWNAGQLARLIGNAILRCITIGECKLALDEAAVQLAPEIVQYLFPSFKVTGIKFNDINGNGERDGQEPGIQGWLFTVSTTNAPRVYDAFTNGSGVFAIEGQYPRSTETLVVTEILQNGWTVTTPLGEIHDNIPFVPPPEHEFDEIVYIDAGLYGNFQLGEISGFKYNDANGNGARDAGEEGLFGWTILLKNATSGTIINNTSTDASGLYHFIGLVAGSYGVEEVQQEGYTQTEPASGSYVIDIQSGTFSLGNDFGNRLTPALGPNVIGNSGFESGGLTVDAREPRGQWGSAGTRFGGNAIITTEDKHSGTHSLKITSATSKAAYVYQYYSLGGTTYSYSLWYKGSGDATAEVTTGWGPPPWFLGGPLNAKVGAAMSLGRGLLPMDGQWHKTTVVNTPSAQALFLDGNQIACGSGNSILPTETLIGDLSTNAENTIVLYVDDVSLATGQEYPVSCPSAPTPPGGPYHYVELNQTSANVTRPGSVTIEVEVEWYDPAWPAQPVELTIANMTGTNITYTTENLYNTTEYQKFEITFNVTVDVQLGEYFVPIVAREIETGYEMQNVLVLRVE